MSVFILQVTDIGDSMVVHTFGAYFGLAVARVLYKKGVQEAKDKEASVYQSDMFAMIGRIVGNYIHLINILLSCI